jgi:hypothetical protein
MSRPGGAGAVKKEEADGSDDDAPTVRVERGARRLGVKKEVRQHDT